MTVAQLGRLEHLGVFEERQHERAECVASCGPSSVKHDATVVVESLGDGVGADVMRRPMAWSASTRMRGATGSPSPSSQAGTSGSDRCRRAGSNPPGSSDVI